MTMSSSLIDEKRRRKKLKRKKFDENILKSFLSDLMGNGASRKRRRSRSSSASSSASSTSEGSSRAHYRREDDRRRRNRCGKYGSSSRRRRTRSKITERDEENIAQKNQSSKVDDESTIESVASHVDSTQNQESKDDEVDTQPTGKDSALAATSTTIRIANKPHEDAEREILEQNKVFDKDKDINDITTEEEFFENTQKNAPVVEISEVSVVPENTSKPIVESNEVVEGSKEVPPDASVADVSASSKEATKTSDKNEESQTTNVEKSLEAQRREDREKSVQAEYNNLVESWKSIVKQGLSISATEELLSKYRMDNDSHEFRAPILNQNLKSFLNGVEIVIDELEIGKQNQLGASIHAIQVATRRIVYGQQRSSDLAKILVTTNDVARTMAQLHYSTSIARRQRVLRNLEMEYTAIENCIGETLFSVKEETEIVDKILDRRLLEKMNEEVEKRLAASKTNPTDQLESKDDSPQAEKKDNEESDGPCSQRFGASRHFKRNEVQAKGKIEKDLKSEQKLKAKAKSNEFDRIEKFPGFAEMTRMARLRQGYPEIAIPVVMTVLAPTTAKSYEKHMEKWWDFSHRESVDTFDPRMHDVMEFLTELYINGATVNTLNVARSALTWITSKDLGKNEDLAMLYRGFAKKCI